MAVLFNRNPVERPELSSDKEANLKVLGSLPEGTLVFWDGEIGPSWYGINDRDIEGVGYRRLFSRKYELPGRVFGNIRFRYGGIRHQEMHLLYREKAALRVGQ